MRWIGASSIVPALCAAALLGAALWSLVARPTNVTFDSFSGSRVTIEGVIVRDPDIREKAKRLTVFVDTLNGEAVLAQTNVLISADRFTEVSYGDRVLATGILKKPELFDTESGRTFNYPKYLLAHGITHEMSFAEVSPLAHGGGNRIVAALLSVKHLLISGIRSALPEPESALLSGLLLGEKQSLGEKITDTFRNAGVIHIIVLSGYNVALVIQAVLFLVLRVFSRNVAYAVAALFVIGFAIMTGLTETTLRATLMALLMIIATVLRRPQAALRGLLIAAALMAVWNPYVVLYDLSFQLSVLATLGLVLFSDKFAARMLFIPETLGLRDVVATTLSTQAVVLPLLILSVGQVSLLFLPANILVLPAVPLAMFFGFFASVLALVSTALAFPVAAIAYGLLTYIIHVSVWIGSVPYAALSIPYAWVWPLMAALLIFYGALFLFFSKEKPRKMAMPIPRGFS